MSSPKETSSSHMTQCLEARLKPPHLEELHIYLTRLKSDSTQSFHRRNLAFPLQYLMFKYLTKI